jgi:hypothetical protein
MPPRCIAMLQSSSRLVAAPAANFADAATLFGRSTELILICTRIQIGRAFVQSQPRRQPHLTRTKGNRHVK